MLSRAGLLLWARLAVVGSQLNSCRTAISPISSLLSGPRSSAIERHGAWQCSVSSLCVSPTLCSKSPTSSLPSMLIKSNAHPRIGPPTCIALGRCCCTHDSWKGYLRPASAVAKTALLCFVCLTLNIAIALFTTVNGSIECLERSVGREGTSAARKTGSPLASPRETFWLCRSNGCLGLASGCL